MPVSTPPHPPRKPVILLAFANDLTGGGGYLRNLSQERRCIEEALGRVGDRARIVVHSGVRIDDLFDLLDAHNDDIVIFHFGGHAEAKALVLEDDHGRPELAHMAGLAKRLGNLPSLSLIFLNGCSTRSHVEALRLHSNAPIIATDESIVDEYASLFANRFYRALSVNRPVDEAFNNAESELTARKGFVASAVYRPEITERRMIRAFGCPDPAPEWPWHLDIAQDNPGSADWCLKHVLDSWPPPASTAPPPVPVVAEPAPAAGGRPPPEPVSAVAEPAPAASGRPLLAPRRLAIMGLTIGGASLVVATAAFIGHDCSGQTPPPTDAGAADLAPPPTDADPPPPGDAAPPPPVDAAPPSPVDAAPPPPVDAAPPPPVDAAPPPPLVDAAPPPPPPPPPPPDEEVLERAIVRALDKCACDDIPPLLARLERVDRPRAERLRGLHDEACRAYLPDNCLARRRP